MIYMAILHSRIEIIRKTCLPCMRFMSNKCMKTNQFVFIETHCPSDMELVFPNKSAFAALERQLLCMGTQFKN